MSDIQKAIEYLDRAADGVVELEKLLTAIPALAPESGGDGEWNKAEALEATPGAETEPGTERDGVVAARRDILQQVQDGKIAAAEAVRRLSELKKE